MADSPFIFEGTPENFHSLVIEGSFERPVLVDFWADWCNPCQMLMPIVTKLAEDYQGGLHLVKVNSDQQQELAAQFAVRSLPTLKLFRNGEVVEDIMGAQSESALKEMLDKYIERESDQLVLQAQAMADQGQYEEARQLLIQANQEDPNNKRIPLDLARVYVLSGDHDNADEILKAIPMDQRETEEVKILQAQMQFARIVKDSPEPEELEVTLSNTPEDHQSRYLLSAWQALNGDYEAALGQLLEIMKRDRNWDDDAARKGMLSIFDLLGGQGDLVGRYRRQMFNLLH